MVVQESCRSEKEDAGKPNQPNGGYPDFAALHREASPARWAQEWIYLRKNKM